MRKLKIILLIMLIFIVSGCSVKYNLEINEDLSVDETVEASEITNRLKSKTNMDSESAVEYIYEMFSTSDMEFNSSEEDDVTTGIATRSFDTLDEFQTMFTSDVFNTVSINKEKNNISFEAVQSTLLESNGSNSLLYDDIEVRINVPFDVKSNNADQIDGDTYIWNISKNEKEPKKIKLNFNIKTKESAASIEVGKDVININYSYIIIGVIVVGILAIVVFVTIKNKKNNVI